MTNEETITQLKQRLNRLEQQQDRDNERILGLTHNTEAHSSLTHEHLEHQIRGLSHWKNCGNILNPQHPCDCQTTPGKPSTPETPITWPLHT